MTGGTPVLSFWYSLTIFVAAALLFLVQPLFARMVLPLLGGTPAVWNTCMVFFQAALLAGYAYAHAGPAWLGVRRHAVLHLLLLLAAAFCLPLALPATWLPSSESPLLWLLGVSVACIGPPFFLLAASGPLFQRWFTQARGGDPYFLYAASNAGSLLGLLAYPFLLEPFLPLAEQSQLWMYLYGVLMVLAGGCVLTLLRREPETFTPALSLRLGWREARWVLLAFVPSTLLLSSTTYITSDLAAAPLLWVLPLALYLLTFIVAFGRGVGMKLAGRLVAPLIVFLLLALLTESTEPGWLLAALHLAGLLGIGLMCHGMLASERPEANELTGFYLCLALGGVLGGAFNALVAPLLFDRLLEYPLALMLAAFLTPPRVKVTGFNRLDWLLPLGLTILTTALVFGFPLLHLPLGAASAGVLYALPIVVLYTLHDRPARFGLGVAALLFASSFDGGQYGTVDLRTRSFFGAHRVSQDRERIYRRLVHGNTIHGLQSLDDEGRKQARAYYHAKGPAGKLMQDLKDDPRSARVALVGLGVGAMAAHARKGQHWTFFEIDPAVVHIARDSGLFTYLADSPAQIDVRIGDGRLMLAQSEEKFGVIFIDAFTSDSIPTHLLTREALRIYRERLLSGGLIAIHVSNRYLDLEPVVAALAADGDPPMIFLTWNDSVGDPDEGRLASEWVLLAENEADVKAVTKGFGWYRDKCDSHVPVWRDDFSNLLGAFRWRWGGD